jgi:hypothetical protein
MGLWERQATNLPEIIIKTTYKYLKYKNVQKKSRYKWKINPPFQRAFKG